MAETSALASSSTLTNGDAFHPYQAELPLNDALPYFDKEIETHPGLRERVERGIQSEMSKLEKVDAARLPPPLQPFEGRPELAAEVERAGRGEVLQAVDTARLRLPAPEGGLEASNEEWEQALDNAASQLLYQEGRITNIELLKKFGANHWRLHNFQQEAFSKQFEQAAEAINSQTTSLNRRRRQQQTDAGAQLASLERKWTELISRGLQLEVANISAEHEIQALELEHSKLQQELAAMEA